MARPTYWRAAEPKRAYDVVIVGGGGHGLSTAYYLAKAGLDVLLLEKTAFPREKVCGDGLTPRATKQLVARKGGIEEGMALGFDGKRPKREIVKAMGE